MNRRIRRLGVAQREDIIGPDHPRDGYDADSVRLLLREVFKAATGTHDDFDEYDRAMLEDRRAAVFISPDRVLGN